MNSNPTTTCPYKKEEEKNSNPTTTCPYKKEEEKNSNPTTTCPYKKEEENNYIPRTCPFNKEEINPYPGNGLPENKESSLSCPYKKDDKKKSIKKRRGCPFKIGRTFIKQFLQFFSIRALLTFVHKLIKIKFNIFKLSLPDLVKIFFNTNNLRTGLFLSLMPALFRYLNSLFDSTKLNIDKRILTFISGFVSSLIGICISEKANIMNFIILSVFVRSLHSLLVVVLKKKGYEPHNKLVSYLVLNLACSGVLFLSFYHPSFTPISKLVNRYSLFEGSEKEEVNSIREILRIDKNI